MSADGRAATAARLLAAGLVAAVLGGCGDSDSGPKSLDLPSASGSSSGGSEEPSGKSAPERPAGVPEPQAAPEQGQKVEDDYGVYALRLPEKQPARTVAQTLVDYMDVRTHAYFSGAVDLPRLSGLAMGQPLTDVQGYVVELEQKGLHTVGRSWFEVAPEDVTVQGRSAELAGVCMLNASVDANRQNVAVESPPDAYLTKATLRKFAEDLWLVTSIGFEPTESC